MPNLTEHRRTGESERQNLETQLERLNKAIQGKKPETEPKKEQSMEVGKVQMQKVRDARNLGEAGTGRVNTEELTDSEISASSWRTQDREDRSYIYRTNKTGYITRNTGM